MNDKMYIYILKDPDNLEVRYVGRTNNPKKRLSSHLNPDKTRSLPSTRWALRLKRENKKPIMEIVEETNDWEASEVKWIAHYRFLGADLLNIDDGGIVEIHKYNHYKRTSSKKYRSVISKLSSLPEMNEESVKFWHTIRDGIKKIRTSIRLELGDDAVFYFDDCIYAEFVTRKPMSFRVLP